jgi:hypothetical protein
LWTLSSELAATYPIFTATARRRAPLGQSRRAGPGTHRWVSRPTSGDLTHGSPDCPTARGRPTHSGDPRPGPPPSLTPRWIKQCDPKLLGQRETRSARQEGGRTQERPGHEPQGPGRGAPKNKSDKFDDCQLSEDRHTRVPGLQVNRKCKIKPHESGKCQLSEDRHTGVPGLQVQVQHKCV